VIEHLDLREQETALKEIRRVLKETGILIISMPNLATKLPGGNFCKENLKGPQISISIPVTDP
jgi:predicted SAM-dependent methyltransferase